MCLSLLYMLPKFVSYIMLNTYFLLLSYADILYLSHHTKIAYHFIIQHKRIPRHTEGLLDTATFPINYFSISQVGQFFKDLSDWFPSKLPENYWRFMKTEDYGPAIDPPPELGPEISNPLYE